MNIIFKLHHRLKTCSFLLQYNIQVIYYQKVMNKFNAEMYVHNMNIVSETQLPNEPSTYFNGYKIVKNVSLIRKEKPNFTDSRFISSNLNKGL